MATFSQKIDSRPQCAWSEHEKLDLRPKKELRQYRSKSVAYVKNNTQVFEKDVKSAKLKQ